MLKLIEITSSSRGYDMESKTCKSSYSLREIYLNPDHIIMMRNNSSLNGKAKRHHLVDGLSENAVFTELVISTPGHMSKVLNIVGSPDEIFENCSRASRT
tara:strand:+ start:243 stop:542 length:300 start_codon:yes stop_codon:yes gene_type:complete